ncbi:MAG: fused MFS/spermidine synthase [Planctomycetota bacterium]
MSLVANNQSDPAGSVFPARQGVLTFAAATLLGAFLVFQVQPVISKCVLPWFGGTPAVWTTCLLFFQVLLFGGYLYAHCLRRFLSPIGQGILHIGLLLIAAWSLPIEPSDQWKPLGTEDPTWALLTLLAAHVALPYFVLSSTGPLVQAWLSYENDDPGVYRLYALSNAGSLAALLSYPFVVEPLLSVSEQSTMWSAAFGLFVVIKVSLAVRVIRRRMSLRETSQDAPSDGQRSNSSSWTWTDGAVWVGLPALASVMLLVVTSHVCQDIAVIPFLWVLPLSLYLISFIISFDSPAWYRPKLVAAATAFAFGLVQLSHVLSPTWRVPVEAFAYLVVLLGVCLLCHGETARRQPATDRLTLYYAMMSAGGAIGGLLVAIVCPSIFHDYRELPIAMSISMGLVGVTFLAARSWWTVSCDWKRTPHAVKLAVPVVLLLIVASLTTEREDTIEQRRNFFGVLRVEQNDRRVKLVHGNTIHGIQIRGDDHATATSYYGTQSGVGKTLEVLQEEHDSLRVGIIGLGCGVLATYGRAADHFDMFEINPAVVAIAESHFTFLSDCPSSVQHHIGDGRLLLERMVDVEFDCLIVDAFSSDAIPAHLLTLEAMQLYRSRLRPNGVLAMHLSNNHLDLLPLAHRLVREAGLDSRHVDSQGHEATCTRDARWLIASQRDKAFWDHSQLNDAIRPDENTISKAPRWTDQHHNLASVLRLPSF